MSDFLKSLYGVSDLIYVFRILDDGGEVLFEGRSNGLEAAISNVGAVERTTTVDLTGALTTINLNAHAPDFLEKHNLNYANCELSIYKERPFESYGEFTETSFNASGSVIFFPKSNHIFVYPHNPVAVPTSSFLWDVSGDVPVQLAEYPTIYSTTGDVNSWRMTPDYDTEELIVARYEGDGAWGSSFLHINIQTGTLTNTGISRGTERIEGVRLVTGMLVVGTGGNASLFRIRRYVRGTWEALAEFNPGTLIYPSGMSQQLGPYPLLAFNRSTYTQLYNFETNTVITATGLYGAALYRHIPDTPYMLALGNHQATDSFFERYNLDTQESVRIAGRCEGVIVLPQYNVLFTLNNTGRMHFTNNNLFTRAYRIDPFEYITEIQVDASTTTTYVPSAFYRPDLGVLRFSKRTQAVHNIDPQTVAIISTEAAIPSSGDLGGLELPEGFAYWEGTNSTRDVIRDFRLQFPPLEHNLFKGQLVPPFVRNLQGHYSLTARTKLLDVAITDEINLAQDSAVEHVKTLVNQLDDFTLDATSFAEIDDSSLLAVNITPQNFSTYKDLITALSWVGRFAVVVVDGNIVTAKRLYGLPSGVVTIPLKDVFTQDFKIATRNESDLFTKLTVRDTFGNSVSWRRNEELWGLKGLEFLVPGNTAFTFTVSNAANFWMWQLSVLWYRFEVRVPYKFIGLQPYDYVQLENISDYFPQQEQNFAQHVLFSRHGTQLTLASFTHIWRGGGLVSLTAVPTDWVSGDSPFFQVAGLGTFFGFDENYKLVFRRRLTGPDSQSLWRSEFPQVTPGEAHAFTVSYDDDTDTLTVVLNGNNVSMLQEVTPDIDSIPPTTSTQLKLGHRNSDGNAGDNHRAYEGFVYNVSLKNEAESINAFYRVDSLDDVWGLKELQVVPTIPVTALDSCTCRVLRSNVNMDGSVTLLLESDIDASTNMRDNRYWLGEDQLSGIILLGATPTTEPEHSFVWRRIIEGFTKYQIDIEKNGAPFEVLEVVSLTAVSNVLASLTAEESNNYVWKVRGFIPDPVQPEPVEEE